MRLTWKSFVLFSLAILTAVMVSMPYLRTWHHNRVYPTIFQRQVGTGKPVFLLHGLSGSSRYWRPLVEKIKDQLEMTVVDLKGFGRSPWPSTGYSAREHVNFAMQAAPEGRFSLIGHSLGSLVALEMALTHPDRLDLLILMAPPMVASRDELKQILKKKSAVESVMALDTFWAPFICHIHETLGPLSFHLLRPFIDSYMPDFLVRDAILHRWESYNESLESVILGAKIVEMIDRLQLPKNKLWILAGSEDSYTKVSVLRELTDNLIEIPGGHNFLWENQDHTLDTLAKILTPSEL